jgi:hypothetical protein
VTEQILEALDVAGRSRGMETAGFSVEDDATIRVGQVGFPHRHRNEGHR